MRDHTKLHAFNLADEVALMIYQITRNFPKEEKYGLTSQLRRAAVLTASNIVEGCARESQIEYSRFLEIAYGSLREVEYQLSLAHRLEYIEATTFLDSISKISEAQKVLYCLMKSMRKVSSYSL